MNTDNALLETALRIHDALCAMKTEKAAFERLTAEDIEILERVAEVMRRADDER